MDLSFSLAAVGHYW